MQNLLGSQSAPRMPTHSIRQNNQGSAPQARVGKNGNPILLLFAISLMLRNASINLYRHRNSLVRLIALNDDIDKL